MGINRLPDSKGWDKIAEEAFSSSETHVFSDEYCRRRAELQRGVTMKRTSSGNRSMSTRIAAAAAAFIIIPGATIAGTHFLTHRSSGTDPGAEVIVEPSSEENNIVIPEQMACVAEDAEIHSLGETFPLAQHDGKITACVEEQRFNDSHDINLNPLCNVKAVSNDFKEDSTLNINVNTADPEEWEGKALITRIKYTNNSDEQLELSSDMSLVGIAGGKKAKFSQSDNFDVISLYRWDTFLVSVEEINGTDIKGSSSTMSLLSDEDGKYNLAIDPGETITVESMALIENEDVDKAMLIGLEKDEYGRINDLVKLKDGSETDVYSYSDSEDISENTADVGAEQETTVSEAESETECTGDLIEYNTYDGCTCKAEYTIIPDGYTTGEAYEGKYCKAGENGGITPIALDFTDDIDAYLKKLDTAESGINPEVIPHVKTDTYQVKTVDEETPDATVYVLHRNIANNTDPDCFDRDVVVSFDGTPYVQFIYAYSSVTEDELNQFISGIKIVQNDEADDISQ
ncbi:MAG: hypothetical protein IJK31_07420 [Ruminococcus sp.]|nr:hypothetical protein [Ruminococcus sp.]